MSKETIPAVIASCLTVVMCLEVQAAVRVGVIPEVSGQCPKGSSYHWIKMDDEDDDNASATGGWVGAITQDNIGISGTQFEFCSVPGVEFRRHPALPYGVIHLGDQCPSGSFPIARVFHNERFDNRNAASAGIFPSYQTKNNRTVLRMCHFPPFGSTIPGGSKEAYFPSFDVPYGVFAPRDAAWVLRSGVVHTDDQDSAFNDNRYLVYDSNHNIVATTKGPPGGVDYLRGRENTTITVAKVSSGCVGAEELVGQDARSCCLGVAIGSAKRPGYEYEWSPAAGLSCTTCSQPSVTSTSSPPGGIHLPGKSRQVYTLRVTCPTGRTSFADVTVEFFYPSCC